MLKCGVDLSQWSPVLSCPWHHVGPLFSHCPAVVRLLSVRCLFQERNGWTRQSRRVAERSRICWNGEHRACRAAGQHVIARVIFRCRWIGHDDDPGRQPGISLKDQSGRTLERSQNMCTGRDWQFLEPADVLAGYHEQTIETRAYGSRPRSGRCPRQRRRPRHASRCRPPIALLRNSDIPV